ncbi:competence type IV pilus major pilin ComGC [Oceanobacillus salinisoli]|uniref:competence type IV pilus major pilin ComGC n=1 Tax=Oceanobacillus salinisoli TaxID=2678611 RepID=UPI001E5E698F|nr:type II secretion system protein [Oceanobacillus salinisoli]
MERFKKWMKKEKGFTLVELLAVIAILGIIVAIAVPSIGNVIGKAEGEAEEANKELLENAARLAHASGLSTNTTADSQPAYTLNLLSIEGYLDEVPDGFQKADKVKVIETSSGGLNFEFHE